MLEMNCFCITSGGKEVLNYKIDHAGQINL